MLKFTIILFLSGYSLFARAQNINYKLLVGTYTNTGKSEGIYIYDYNPDDANTVLKTIKTNIANPNFLSLSSDKKYVYVVHEKDNIGSLSAFKLDTSNNELTILNTVDTQGAGPCHVTANEQNVIVSNYKGGSLAVFDRLHDGSLSNAVQVIHHTGKSVNKSSQLSAHVHMSQFTPDHRYVVCNDLGEDKTYIYHYNPFAMDQTLTLANVVVADPGSGPRHLTFSPNGKFGYLVNELTGIITSFSYQNGRLNEIQRSTTVPLGFKGKIDGADIHISADGEYLYQTNRGDVNSISTFSIRKSGKLKFVEALSNNGKDPRNFAIDPLGRFVLAAYQYSDEVIIFNRDKKTGRLSDSGKRIKVGAPSCLLFLR